MFNVPGVSTVCASSHELADFAELMAWRDGKASTTDLSQAIGRENDYGAGAPEEDEAEHDAESAYVEIKIRDCACGTSMSYPFSIDVNGNTLARNSEGLNCRQLFDRCRIVDFCDSVAEDVLEEVRTWTEAAAKGTKLPNP